MDWNYVMQLELLKKYLKMLLAEVAKTEKQIEEEKLIKEFNDNCE
jgi:hypothetical protein